MARIMCRSRYPETAPPSEIDDDSGPGGKPPAFRWKPGKYYSAIVRGDITTHYSAPELEELLEAANRVCDSKSGITPAVVVLKQTAPATREASP